MSDDSWNLARFVDAQDSGGTYDMALGELRAGSKRSHWMWFVFPQVAGLGRTDMARRYAIAGLDEARAYLEHATLGARLVECAQALADLDADHPVTVLGSVDAMKLRSSMTLFLHAATDAEQRGVFGRVLDQYYQGGEDQETLPRI